MNRDEFLTALKANAARHADKKGRPPEDSVAALDTGMRAIAIEVFAEERVLGRHRGDFMKAVREVVRRYARQGFTYRGRVLDEQTLRKAAQRHSELRQVADLYAELDRQEKDWAELRRRMPE